MAKQSSFQDLISQLRAGDQDAAKLIYERYAQQLIAKACLHLDTDIKRMVDPEDVIQSVYRSFFIRFADGQFRLENWESLWGLLITITLRKCGRKKDYYHTDKRDVRRESPPHLNNEDSLREWEAIAREPTSEEVVILEETMERMMEGFKPRHREMISLYLQGNTQQEVSEEIGCSERTVKRILSRARRKLKSDGEINSTSE